MNPNSNRTPNTDWKSTKDPSKNDPRYVELRRIFKQEDYTKRLKALKEYDQYDCQQSRDFVELIARRKDIEENFDVKLLAHSICHHRFRKKFKFHKPREIERIPEYQSIQNCIKRVCNKLGIESADELDDQDRWVQFIKQLHADHLPQCNMLNAKFPRGLPKLRDFVKKEYNFLFQKKIKQRERRLQQLQDSQV